MNAPVEAAALGVLIAVAACRGPSTAATPGTAGSRPENPVYLLALFPGHECNASEGPAVCAIECTDGGGHCTSSPDEVTCRCAAIPRGEPPPPDPAAIPEAVRVASCGCDVPNACVQLCDGPQIPSCDCGTTPSVCGCVDPPAQRPFVAVSARRPR